MQKPVAIPDDLSIGDVRALEDSVQNLLLLWRPDSAWQVENATGTPFRSISPFLVDGLEQQRTGVEPGFESGNAVGIEAANDPAL